MIKKIKNKKGITLTELLASILILGMLGTIISVGITTGTKVYSQSVQFSEANFLVSLIIQKISDEIRKGENFKYTSNIMTFNSKGFGDDVSFTINSDGHIMLGSEIILSETVYTNGLSVSEFKVILKPNEKLVKLEFNVVDTAGSVEAEIGKTVEEEFHIGYLN